MKRPRPMPTQMDQCAIVVPKNGKWEILHWNRIMGHSQMGPRLTRNAPLPDLPTIADTRVEAEELARMWQAWLDDRPIRKTNKR